MSNQDNMAELPKLVRERLDSGQFILTPRIVSKALGTSFVESVKRLEHFRASSPEHISIFYRAVCSECQSPNLVNEHFDDIVTNTPFDIYCAICSTEFLANENNIFIEYHLANTNPQKSQGDSRGGHNPPRRQPLSTLETAESVENALSNIPLDQRPLILLNPTFHGPVSMTIEDKSVRQTAHGDVINDQSVRQSGQVNAQMRDGVQTMGSSPASVDQSTGSSKGSKAWIVIVVAIIGAIGAIIAAMVKK